MYLVYIFRARFGEFRLHDCSNPLEFEEQSTGSIYLYIYIYISMHEDTQTLRKVED